MKRIKISFLIMVVLLTSLMASCIPGQGQPASGWSGTAFHDGVIYVGTGDGKVVAINATSREEQWPNPYSFATEGSGGLACGPATVADAIYTTPVVDGGSVHVGTYSGKIYALSTATGARRWSYPEDGNIGAVVGSPVVADDTIYVSTSDGMVYALYIGNGDVRWQDRLQWKSEPLADKLWTSPTVTGDTLYVSTFDGHIYALSAEDGGLLDWTFQLEAGLASSPVIYGDTIYVGSFDNNLYAIKIGASEHRWRFQGGRWFWGAPLVHDGVVYAGSLDGRLYLIDSETGDKLGEFDAGSPIVSSPVIMDDLLIVASQSGDVYVFDLSSALQDRTVPVMSVQLDAKVESTFCASEGLAYIRAEDKLYVVDVEKGWITWELSLMAEE
ncbi:MAG: PQQ-binding-like beta-propeller repeat protein [Dehalococcoidia bacterium]